jgi:hypothetical protein
MKNLMHLGLISSGITYDAIEHVARIGRNLKYLSLTDTSITAQNYVFWQAQFQISFCFL